jgi:four helix bundle protein
MGTIRSFRDLEVWNLAMELVVDCYGVTRRYPVDEKYTLSRETRRSALSIPSNVAEGHNRHTSRMYLNHVSIALGSHGELETQLEVARRLAYVSAAELQETLEKLARVGQMLHRLQASLEARVQRRTLIVSLTFLGGLACGVLLA